MSRFDRRCDTEVHEVRRLEVINGDLGRRKWSAERKGEIVAESMQPGVVVSEVARRHNLTPQQLFAWRHDAKQGRLGRFQKKRCRSFRWWPLPTTPAHRLGPRGRRRDRSRSIFGAAVIKAPEGVQAKHLTKVLRAVKAVL